MGTHTYSIAVAHLQTGDWSVAIVQTTLQRGVIVDQELVYGPTWCSELALKRVVSDQLEAVQQLIRQEETGQPTR